MARQGSSAKRIIGLIPASGSASRLGPLPCSKEIYPIGFRGQEDQVRPRVACHALLESMKAAGAEAAYFVIASGKWDIPDYLSADGHPGLPLAYVVTRDSPNTPTTIDHARPFTRDARVLFGFPDVLFTPGDAFVRLIAHQDRSKADVVLGLFPTETPHKMDMVELDDAGRVEAIRIKSRQTASPFAWLIASWEGDFSAILHDYLSGRDAEKKSQEKGRELYMGDVLLHGLEVGLRIEGVTFPDGTCTDIGTPSDLLNAVRSEARGFRGSGPPALAAQST